jgi:hypothetical protein
MLRGDILRSARLAEHLDAPLLAQELQHLLHHRTGQRQTLDQTRQVEHTGIVQVLAQQVAKEILVEAGFDDVLRLRRQTLYGLALAGVGTAVADRIHEAPSSAEGIAQDQPGIEGPPDQSQQHAEKNGDRVGKGFAGHLIGGGGQMRA